MGPIVRLATFVLALALVTLGFLLPWFHIDYAGGLDVGLEAVPFRGSSGLVIELCDQCPEMYSGGLPGGLAWLGSHVALQFGVSLVVSGWLVLQGHRQPAIAAWTILSAVVLAVLTVGVLVLFEAPRGVEVGVGASAGLWCALGACVLAVVGHTRMIDRVVDAIVRDDDEDVDEGRARAMPSTPSAIAEVERRSRPSAAAVRGADVGHAGLTLRTEGGERRVRWDELVGAQLITGVDPAVELRVADAAWRITRRSAVDYRFLPGRTDGGPVEDLRRLYEFAREKNPALRR